LANIQVQSTPSPHKSIIFSWLLLSILLVSCGEDPGVVGSTFIQDDAEINSDTVAIDDFKTTPLKAFSGRTSFISVGQYDDQLFGNIKATALFRPRVYGARIDTMIPDAKLSLNMKINTAKVYGDTTAATEFDIVEIADPWRSNAWRRDSMPRLTNNVIVSGVSLGMEDSVNIDLPASFRDRYRDYLYYEPEEERDDHYNSDFQGFALVPTNTSKILPLQVSGDQQVKLNLLVINETDEDTTQYTSGLDRWAYSVERGTDNIDTEALNAGLDPEDLTPLYSTYENIAHMNFPVNREFLNIQSQNLSRAELTLYEARSILDNTLLDDHVRPTHDKVRLMLRDSTQLNESVLNEQATFSVGVDSTDFTYRYNMTSFFNELIYAEADISDQRYFISVETNSGILYSTLLYTAQSDEDFPKILITSVKSTVTN
jgi:hypothetical protein